MNRQREKLQREMEKISPERKDELRTGKEEGITEARGRYFEKRHRLTLVRLPGISADDTISRWTQFRSLWWSGGYGR